MVLCLFSVSFSFLFITASCELFTAITDLEVLLSTEAVMLDNLEKYIKWQEDRLHTLKMLAEEYGKVHDLANTDTTKFLSNPINAYQIIKRLLVDWRFIENLTVVAIPKEKLLDIDSITTANVYPTEEDLKGAVSGLVRLQKTYSLETSPFADGVIRGIQYSTKLTASDCLEIAKGLYHTRDFKYAHLWMSEAQKRHTKEGNRSRIEIHELQELSYLINQTADDDKTKSDHLQQTCRDDISPSMELLSRLKCRYIHKNGFLRLAPLKEEEAYLEPRIVLYRDAVDNYEIEIVKSLAKKNLKRARISEALEISSRRISKTAWLEDSQHDVIKSLSQRVEYMTDLSVTSAENLQVVNYGIGGHYTRHYDFTTSEKGKRRRGSGRTSFRIATVLFYMSDVEQGGSTVFPKLNLSVKPEKGSALFWYNLHEDNVGDFRMLHTACPVLTGSKWISTKWLNAEGQEFKRPCLLKPSEDNKEWFYDSAEQINSNFYYAIVVSIIIYQRSVTIS